MNEIINNYIKKYPIETQKLFIELRQLIFDSVSISIEEKMWAKIPSYYSNELFIRLIPFKDHINIEASKIVKYKAELINYKITPKGMLQIYIKEAIPLDKLRKIFIDKLIN